MFFNDARKEEGNRGEYWLEDNNIGSRRGEWGTMARTTMTTKTTMGGGGGGGGKWWEPIVLDRGRCNNNGRSVNLGQDNEDDNCGSGEHNNQKRRQESKVPEDGRLSCCRT